MTSMPIDPAMLERMALAAQAAAQHSYAPYSRFPVGAAILTDDGSLFAGCNVENASCGLTICAERNAIFQAVAHGHRTLTAVVVYTPTPTPTSPCGACRQVINEFGPAATVVCLCDGPDRIVTSMGALLPHAFGPQNLDAE